MVASLTIHLTLVIKRNSNPIVEAVFEDLDETLSWPEELIVRVPYIQEFNLQFHVDEVLHKDFVEF